MATVSAINVSCVHIQLTFWLTLAVWYTALGQALTRRLQYTLRSDIKPPGVRRESKIGTGSGRLNALNSFINNDGRRMYRPGDLSWSVPLSIASEAIKMTLGPRQKPRLSSAPYHWNWFPTWALYSASSDPLKIRDKRQYRINQSRLCVSKTVY